MLYVCVYYTEHTHTHTHTKTEKSNDDSCVVCLKGRIALLVGQFTNTNADTNKRGTHYTSLPSTSMEESSSSWATKIDDKRIYLQAFLF